jgi:hypothetical protein
MSSTKAFLIFTIQKLAITIIKAIQ